MSNSTSETDAEIIARVVEGNRDAYALLVDRYAPVVRRFLAGRGLRGFELDEASQDVFVSVYRNLENLRQRAQFSSYLMTAARRRLIDSQRSQPRNEPGPNINEIPDRNNDDVSGPGFESLQSAIARLPESMQVTLGLKFAGQHTAAEIAEILGQTENSVTKTLSRAYAKLRADSQLRKQWQEGE